MNQRALRLGAVLIITVVLGCGGDKTTTSPPLSIVGSYMATQWVTTGTSGQTNQLLAGSTLNLNLASDGSTSGHLHVAASGNNPALDQDMAGTWSQSNDKVTISQSADTFVRDLTFNVVPNGNAWSLSTDQVVNGTRIQLTLDQVFLVAFAENRERSLR